MALPDRLTDRKVVWRALVDASEMAESMIDAYEKMPDDPVVRDMQRLLKAYDRVALKFFGKTVTQAKADQLKGAKFVSIYKLQCDS